MKLIEVIMARETVATLYKEKVKGKLAYKFLKFLKETETEEILYSEKFTELMNQYGEKDENGIVITNGDRFKIKDNLIEDCRVAITDIESIEVDKPSFTITIDELEDVKISMKDMNSLFAFIKEE